jgi:hypothetical protein
MTLDKLLEHGKEAAEHLFEKQGNVLPMWIAETESGSIAPIIMPMLMDKDKSAELIKGALQEVGAVRYVSILEAWIYEPRKDEVDERYLSGEIPVSASSDNRIPVRSILDAPSGASFFCFLTPCRFSHHT